MLQRSTSLRLQISRNYAGHSCNLPPPPGIKVGKECEDFKAKLFILTDRSGLLYALAFAPQKHSAPHLSVIRVPSTLPRKRNDQRHEDSRYQSLY
jgi:hypothetical protein